MARRRPKDLPFESYPLNGLACSVCGKPQRKTPGGQACENGHGGAEGVDLSPRPAPPSIVDAVLKVPPSVMAAALGSTFFHGGAKEEGVTPIKVNDPTPLVTIEADDAIWRLGDGDDTREIPRVRGAIIRVRPPADVDDATVDALVALLEGMGARHVFTLPRPRSGVIPEQAQEKNREKAYGAREAVATLVAESNSSDREALEKLTEKIMGEAGL